MKFEIRIGDLILVLAIVLEFAISAAHAAAPAMITSPDGSCKLTLNDDCVLNYVDGGSSSNPGDYVCIDVTKRDSNGKETSFRGWLPKSMMPLKQGTREAFSGSDEESFFARNEMSYDGRTLSIKTSYDVDVLTDTHGKQMTVETDENLRTIKSISTNEYRISPVFGQRLHCSFEQ